MLEISRRLESIDQKVHEAMRAIDADDGVSERTRSAVHRFCDKSEAVLRELNKADTDQNLLLQYVLELENLGDRARDAVKEDKESVDQEPFQAVINAHNSVSQLKAELRGDSNPG